MQRLKNQIEIMKLDNALISVADKDSSHVKSSMMYSESKARIRLAQTEKWLNHQESMKGTIRDNVSGGTPKFNSLIMKPDSHYLKKLENKQLDDFESGMIRSDIVETFYKDEEVSESNFHMHILRSLIT